MKNFAKLSALMLAMSVAISTAPVMAAGPADEVMALARAQWAAEIAGKPVSEQMASVADVYTEFNPSSPYRFDSKELNSRFYTATEADGSKSIAADMQNAHVQAYGDTAILSYNYIGVIQAKDGKTTPSNGKSTRVYSRINGKWMLVHAHFSGQDQD